LKKRDAMHRDSQWVAGPEQQVHNVASSTPQGSSFFACGRQSGIRPRSHGQRNAASETSGPAAPIGAA